MGNTLGAPRREDLRSYLLDSPDIVVHSLLATYKLFKVFHCAHEGYRHGGVIVKLFIPNVPEEEDFNESGIKVEAVLKPYRDATFLLQCKIWGLVHPNVIPYESAEISSHSGLLMRQYFGRNLFDRLYSQPRLTRVHQQWFALQLLCAVAQLHSVGIIHGDIKLENVFVIGSFHAVLTDLATFIKPVYLPLDDPVAATSQFFESGVKRRRCFIAPERFIDSMTSRVLDEHGRRMTFFDKEFTTDFARMDIFSTGLSLAEMYLEGHHVVDLPELLAFRSGSFDLGSVIETIPDVSIRRLVASMTDRDPKLRPACIMDCIENLISSSPPEFESLLLPLLVLSSHPIYANADMRIMFLRRNWQYISGDPEPLTEFEPMTELEIFEHSLQTSVVSRGLTTAIQPLLSWSHRFAQDNQCSIFPHPMLTRTGCRNFTKGLFQLWRDGFQGHLTGQSDTSIQEKVNELYSSSFFTQLSSETGVSTPPSGTSVGDLSSGVGVIIASLLGSTLTACSWTVSKVVCLEMMTSLQVLDDGISDYLVPYIHDVVVNGNSTPSVKEKAIDCLCVIVANMRKAETGLFSEYLFPLCMHVDHPGVVRLAACLVRQAARLSQPDEGGRKLAAIRSFVERFIQQYEIWKWKEILRNKLEIFALINDSKKINDLFLSKIYEGVIDSDDLAACMEEVVALLKRGALWSSESKRLLIALVVKPEQLGILMKYAEGDKGLVVDCCKRLIEFISDPIPAVRENARDVLVQEGGAALSPVDQFVFLRNELPKGCRTLVDLCSARTQLVGKLSCQDHEALGARSISESTLRTVSPHVGSTHVLPVQIINEQFSPARKSDPAKESADLTQLALIRCKDWRLLATDTPGPLPDIGCLSGMDGSLTSLYKEESQGNVQRSFLSSLPCVSVVPGPQWKPESLLLATLNDFCSAGVAVPVVGVDCTDDGRIFAAAGADGTVRVWRTNALETESVLQSSRIIHVPECSRLYALKTIRNSKSIVVGNDSRLLIYRIDSSSAADFPIIQSDQFDAAAGHVVSLNCFDTDTSSCVVAACEKGAIISWDIRTNKLANVFRLNPVYDLIPSSVVLSKDSFGMAVSTLAGNIHIFDNRYLKPVQVYSHSSGPVTALAHSACAGSIWVSAGTDVALFDIRSGGEAKQTMSVNTSGSVPPSPPVLSQEVVSLSPEIALTKLVKPDANARCLMECSSMLLTGHNDGVVRYWNTADRSAGVAFPLQLEPTDANITESHMAQFTVSTSDYFPSTLPNIAGRACGVTEGHRDAILDMCVASLQYDIVVTAGRDGLIKLWK